MARASDRRPTPSIGRPASRAAAAVPFRRDPIAFASGVILIVSLVAAVFSQTGRFGILNFDDDQYLDPLVRRGLTGEGFVRAWTQGHVGNWHPLTTLSFMLDAELFGDWWGGYHLHNVVLQSLASAVLFAALTRFTGAMGRSLVAAAVFAIHQLRAESVAWITERKDVLSGLFLATTLLAYASYVEQPRSRRRYAILLLSFGAGLLSKSMLVTLPLGLLILDWWPLRRLAPFAGGWGYAPRVGMRVRTDVETVPLRALVVEKIPLLALSAASALATVVSVGDVVRPISTLPFAVRASSSVVAYATYVIQLFWPVGLAPHYAYSATGPTAGQVAAAAAFGMALTAGAWFWRRWWPSFTVGWAQTTICRDSETLWRYTLRVTEPNAYAHANLASALAERGDPVEAAEHNRAALALESDNLQALSNLATLLVDRGGLAEAIRLYERSIEVNPKFVFGWLNLGSAYLKAGRMVEAEEAWRKAVELDPAAAAAWTNISALEAERGNWDEARTLAEKADAAGGGAAAAFRRALAIEPRSPLLQFNLAVVLGQQGARAESVALYRQAEEGFRAAGNEPMATTATTRAAELAAEEPAGEPR